MKPGDVIEPGYVEDPPVTHPRQISLPEPSEEWIKTTKRYGEILHTIEPARRGLKTEEWELKEWLKKTFIRTFGLKELRGMADLQADRRFGRSGCSSAWSEPKPGCLPFVDHVVTWKGEDKRVLTSQPYGGYKDGDGWHEPLLARCEEHAQLYDLKWAVSQRWSYHFPSLTFLLWWEAAVGTKKPNIRVLEAARGESLRYSSDW
jgi:hypothetical protein